MDIEARNAPLAADEATLAGALAVALQRRGLVIGRATANGTRGG